MGGIHYVRTIPVCGLVWLSSGKFINIFPFLWWKHYSKRFRIFMGNFSCSLLSRFVKLLFFSSLFYIFIFLAYREVIKDDDGNIFSFFFSSISLLLVVSGSKQFMRKLEAVTSRVQKQKRAQFNKYSMLNLIPIHLRMILQLLRLDASINK